MVGQCHCLASWLRVAASTFQRGRIDGFSGLVSGRWTGQRRRSRPARKTEPVKVVEIDPVDSDKEEEQMEKSLRQRSQTTGAFSKRADRSEQLRAAALPQRKAPESSWRNRKSENDPPKKGQYLGREQQDPNRCRTNESKKTCLGNFQEANELKKGVSDRSSL